jgi:hypothetical protein
MSEEWGHFILIDEKSNNNISPPKLLFYEKNVDTNDKYLSDYDKYLSDYKSEYYDKESKYNELKNSNMVILSKIMFHLCVITTLIISSLKSITSKLSFAKS